MVGAFLGTNIFSFPTATRAFELFSAAALTSVTADCTPVEYVSWFPTSLGAAGKNKVEYMKGCACYGRPWRYYSYLVLMVIF